MGFSLVVSLILASVVSYLLYIVRFLLWSLFISLVEELIVAVKFVKSRLKKHIVDTTHNHFKKYALVEHSYNSKHLICFDQEKILVCAPFYSTWIIREALKIEKHTNNFNIEDGYKLSQSNLGILSFEALIIHHPLLTLRLFIF